MAEMHVCTVTHSQLIEGYCPWCGAFVRNGLVDSGIAPHPELDRKSLRKQTATACWNMHELLASLEDPRRQDITIKNVVDYVPLDIALRLLEPILQQERQQFRSIITTSLLSMRGWRISRAEAQSVEQAIRLAEQPLAARVVLLGRYWHRGSASADALVRRSQHILWLIEHMPDAAILSHPEGQMMRHDDADGYAQARALWLEQVARYSDNPIVLGNAATSFALDDAALAERLFEQANTLEPLNPEWPQQLAQIHQRGSHRGNLASRQMFAALALTEFKQALALHEAATNSKPSDTVDQLRLSQCKAKLHRVSILTELVKVAVDAGELEQAQDCARELLQLGQDSMPGGGADAQAIHHAHLTLGRVALIQGDVEQAKSRLLAAAQIDGSPSLSSFGPNMTLADRLLDADEQETVLKYLEECRRFWKHGQDQIDQWTADIKSGQRPIFGASLVY